jgi:hypothetical protein
MRGGLEILRDVPRVGSQPLDNAGAPQGLQPPHMGVHIGVIVAAGDRHSVGLGNLSMEARPIRAQAPSACCNIVVGRPLRWGYPDLNDAANLRFLCGRGVASVTWWTCPSIRRTVRCEQPYLVRLSANRRERL